LFGTRISTDDAVTALSQAVEDIQQNYLKKAWGHLGPEDPWPLQVELRYLAMYVTDGLIKHTQGSGWPENREALAKRFYAACHRACAIEELEDQNTFLLGMFTRLQYYDDGLSKHIEELSKIADAQTRFVRTTTVFSQLFTERYGQPDDRNNKLIAAGAATAIYLGTEKLFRSRLTI